MKTYNAKDKHWLRFETPTECQGQTVERSFAIDLQDMVALERIEDRSDRSIEYRIADLDDADLDWAENWNYSFGTPTPSGTWKVCKFIGGK